MPAVAVARDFLVLINRKACDAADFTAAQKFITGAGSVGKVIRLDQDSADVGINNNPSVFLRYFGFIKFGSRVDLYFPIGTKINVTLEEKVTGGKSIIATY